MKKNQSKISHFFTFLLFLIYSHKWSSSGLSNVNSSKIVLQCLGRPTPAVLVYRFWVNDAAEWSRKNDQWYNEKGGGGGGEREKSPLPASALHAGLLSVSKVHNNVGFYS